MLLMTKKTMKEKIQKEIKENPVFFGDHIIKVKGKEKWLGDMIDSDGESASVLSTIKSRKGRIMTIILETIAIVEDTRMQRIGGLQCGLDIWKIVISPALLTNSNTWSGLTKSGLEELESILLFFLKRLLRSPNSTPKPSLLYDTDMFKTKFMVHKNILNFVKHVSLQEDDSLAKAVLQEQLSNNWGGLVKEAKDLCERYDISGLLDSDTSKKEFKQQMKRAFKTINDAELKSDMNSYKKMEEMRNENVKKNEYIYNENIYNARMVFKYRSQMFDSKENFKGNSASRVEKLLCDSCETEQDDYTHVLYCNSYKELRKEKDLNNDNHLATYLHKVLSIRNKLKLRM